MNIDRNPWETQYQIHPLTQKPDYLNTPLSATEVNIRFDGDPSDPTSTIQPFVCKAGESVFVAGNEHGELLPVLEVLYSADGFIGVMPAGEPRDQGVVLDFHFDDSPAGTSRPIQKSELAIYNASWISYFLETTQKQTQIVNLTSRQVTWQREISQGANQALTIPWSEFRLPNKPISWVSLDIDLFNFGYEKYEGELRTLIRNLMSGTNLFTLYTSPRYRHEIDMETLVKKIYQDWVEINTTSPVPFPILF